MVSTSAAKLPATRIFSISAAVLIVAAKPFPTINLNPYYCTTCTYNGNAKAKNHKALIRLVKEGLAIAYYKRQMRVLFIKQA